MAAMTVEDALKSVLAAEVAFAALGSKYISNDLRQALATLREAAKDAERLREFASAVGPVVDEAHRLSRAISSGEMTADEGYFHLSFKVVSTLMPISAALAPKEK